MDSNDTTTVAIEAIEGRRAERRRFLAYAGSATAGGAALSLLSACGGDTGSTTTTSSTISVTQTATEVDVLNFALNLEYLEAQYYNYAAYGTATTAALTGVGVAGTLTGGAQVPFTDPIVAQYAREIAADETAHVNFLRALLAGAAVAMPSINIDGSTATSPFALPRKRAASPTPTAASTLTPPTRISCSAHSCSRMSACRPTRARRICWSTRPISRTPPASWRPRPITPG